MKTPEEKHLIAIIGDVHSRIGLAATALNAIEAELGAISQVFSVGDLGLFLDEADWGFLSGSKRSRHPDWTVGIRQEWEKWKWPLAFVGGTNEPWNRLRDFDPAWFGNKLTFTAAGELKHRFLVCELSGFPAFTIRSTVNFQRNKTSPFHGLRWWARSGRERAVFQTAN